ncbi:MAG: hypothetical protein IJO75_01220 [Clostridia bacterium]|nr:hypothetical protein [Clostridia bacterium]MBQ9860857.1 hypothetical protein [Clostridia bacterium]
MANDYKAQGEEAKKKFEEDTLKNADEQKAELQTKYDENIAQAKKETEEQIDKTSDDYLDVVRSAGIQKELDLRDIQETRANMGLSRSGLSATEQTAAILSAGNKVGAAQRNRQQAIDVLEKALLEYETEEGTKLREGKLSIDNTARANIAKHNSDVDQKVMELESDDYQAGVKAQSDATVAQINANAKADDNRVSTLKSAMEDGEFGKNKYTVYEIAVNAGWSTADALKYMPYIDELEDGSWIRSRDKDGNVIETKYVNTETQKLSKAKYIVSNMDLDATGYAALGAKYSIPVDELNAELKEARSDVRIPE